MMSDAHYATRGCWGWLLWFLLPKMQEVKWKYRAPPFLTRRGWKETRRFWFKEMFGL